MTNECQETFCDRTELSGRQARNVHPMRRTSILDAAAYVRLTKDERAGVDAIAKTERRTISDVIREAINAYLAGGVERLIAARHEEWARDRAPLARAFTELQDYMAASDPGLLDDLLVLAEAATLSEAFRDVLQRLARYAAAPPPARRGRRATARSGVDRGPSA